MGILELKKIGEKKMSKKREKSTIKKCQVGPNMLEYIEKEINFFLIGPL